MKRTKILTIVTPIVIGIILLFFGIRSLDNDHYELDFRGKISDIKTDEKGYPYVKINNRELWYPVPQAIGSDLLIGDSLNKESGKSEIKQYRKDKLINSFY